MALTDPASSQELSFPQNAAFYPKVVKIKLSAMVQKMFLRASTLLHNVGNQAQVALDENVPGLQIPLGASVQQFPFLLFGQGFWEAAGLQLQ